MNDMKRLLSYAGPYKRDMIFGAVLVLVETCFYSDSDFQSD